MLSELLAVAELAVVSELSAVSELDDAGLLAGASLEEAELAGDMLAELAGDIDELALAMTLDEVVAALVLDDVAGAAVPLVELQPAISTAAPVRVAIRVVRFIGAPSCSCRGSWFHFRSIRLVELLRRPSRQLGPSRYIGVEDHRCSRAPAQPDAFTSSFAHAGSFSNAASVCGVNFSESRSSSGPLADFRSLGTFSIAVSRAAEFFLMSMAAIFLALALNTGPAASKALITFVAKASPPEKVGAGSDFNRAAVEVNDEPKAS